ncbi:bifunctional NAD(P)H-hydrate repair enzyme [Acidocella aquatica]|uniref:Bifunctional NAD(P)H-hydrate repair enzyme n=1 Tax=Acidocella aquatica TaxID=1922313 RepID=A0ABQ6A9B9_9PROT|nr:NAD(P)H-hydrate dehydratase [Acidocella aquatica]GLR68501.1 bifunctional NAD(P)H-hydrate repair enzyme [Acidocella aquatica]
MNELLTPAEMGRADALAGNAQALMDAAGRAVARAIMQRYAPCSTLVLAGPGNNGGDGHVAADYLRQAGWAVTVRAWNKASVAEVARAGLVIDAIFGAGLARDVSPEVAALLRAAKRLVAIDVPSGLDGATGAVRGYAPQAELTVTFFRAKPGHYLYPGRGLCGELVLRDIGLPGSVLAQINPQTWVNGPALWHLPARAPTGHKYSAGDVSVLCGNMPGAARLACAGARRAGAGMVTLAADAPFLPPEAGLIVRAEPLEVLLQDARRKIWVCGPGLGPLAGHKLARLIAAGRIIVADADALTACAGAPEKLRGAAVITPHEGEFSRVFGSLRHDRLSAARAAARATGAVAVLKGADTIIAAPDGRAAINANAPPYLASGGTGDVLAGIIAALLAQEMPAFEAACAAVWLHGAAALKVGPGLLAEDIPAVLGPLMARLRPPFNPADY